MQTQIIGIKEKVSHLFATHFRGKTARRNIFILIIALASLSLYYYKYYYNIAPTTYEYSKVVKKNLQKTVEGSGTVVSLSELTIQQLQNGGKVTSVNVKPGDSVRQGQIIARLDSRAQAIQVAQARANYDKIINGATDINIQILRQALKNAEDSYNLVVKTQTLNILNAKRNLLNTGVSAVPQYDSKIIANNPTVTGSYTCNDDTEYRVVVQSNDIANVSDSRGNSNSINISSVPQPLGTCGLYLTFDSTKNYNNGDWKITLPNKTSISYFTNLNSYNSAFQIQDTALLSASTTVATANLNLQQQLVGARAEDIAVSKAQLDSANLSYENTIIRAPFDGQIGNVSAIVGQQTNSQQGIATIITKTKLAQISLNEVDVTNVKVGQNVNINFDAIPGEVFKGKIYQMDTVGVAASSVVSFGVKMSIDSDDTRIKSGMSATANIVVDERQNILTVQNGTIKTEKISGEEKKYVMRKTKTSPGNFKNENASSTNITIETTDNSSDATTSPAISTKKYTGKGLSQTGTDEGVKIYIITGISNDLETEVIDGLSEGDRVISKTIDPSAATKKAAASFSLFGGAPGGRGGGR